MTLGQGHEPRGYRSIGVLLVSVYVAVPSNIAAVRVNHTRISISRFASAGARFSSVHLPKRPFNKIPDIHVVHPEDVIILK